MSDFDTLQAAIVRHASTRQNDAAACENLLNALYHAFRGASGRGQPLNNVSMEIVPDPEVRLRPVPVGEFHAAWFRLGLCEVLVRVRRLGGEFHGDYALAGTFALQELTEDAVLGLARRILRDLSEVYAGGDGQGGALN